MKSRFRFYLKLFVALFAVAFTAALLWFIFRIEKYIISRLPKEITVENISVSFLNQSFTATNVRLTGKPGTQCDGKIFAEVAELDGKFLLKERKLTEIRLRKPALKKEALERGCFVKAGEKTEIRLHESVGPAGIKIQVLDGVVPMPEVGALAVDAVLTVRENEHGALVAGFEKFIAVNGLVRADARKIALAFVQGGETLRLSDGEIMGTLKANHLEKISRLSTKKLRVLAGEGEIKFSADIRRGEWTLFTNIDLRHMKLKGEPFYNMPLMQLTPENMWPMAEDSPGFFNFSFKTSAASAKLAKTYAADFRNALAKKIKANLKKKIPVLPF